MNEYKEIDKQMMLANAIRLASDMHYGQFDKGGAPYILHVLKVFHYTKSDDTEVQCAAILHDLCEDTKVTFQDLLVKGFTENVVNTVRLLTKQRGQTQQEYLDGILTSRSAMLVKLADLRHNSDIRRLKGITQKDIERTQKYHEMYLTIKEKLNAAI